MSARLSSSAVRYVLLLALSSVLVTAVPSAAQEKEEAVFSGPQVGEKLAGFKVRALLGDDAGKEFDLVTRAAEKPIALIFVHEVTRPSVALTRLMMEYAAKRGSDGLSAGVVCSRSSKAKNDFMGRFPQSRPGGTIAGGSPRIRTCHWAQYTDGEQHWPIARTSRASPHVGRPASRWIAACH